MLLRTRTPDLDTRPATLRPGLEHLDQGWIAVLRWLNVNRVDHVLVGPVALAIRGDGSARGPVTIVPAPYDRNWERLAGALTAQQAALRSDRTPAARGDQPAAVKLDGDKLARGRRWLLRFAGYDLDVEGLGRPSDALPGAASAGDGSVLYQELLYESTRVELCEGLTVEVAAPEDVEHFSHVRRAGVAPEFRITRNAPTGDTAAEADSSPADTGSQP